MGCSLMGFCSGVDHWGGGHDARWGGECATCSHEGFIMCCKAQGIDGKGVWYLAWGVSVETSVE